MDVQHGYAMGINVHSSSTCNGYGCAMGMNIQCVLQWFRSIHMPYKKFSTRVLRTHPVWVLKKARTIVLTCFAKTNLITILFLGMGLKVPLSSSVTCIIIARETE